MKIDEIIKKNESGVSFEFFPPRTEKGKKSFTATVKALKKYNPLYMSMTYGAGGGSRERTQDAVNILLAEKDLVVMPHLTCIGSRHEEIRAILDAYRERGIENIMALRGDPPQDSADFDFSVLDFQYARDLVVLIKEYGHFCISVAVCPEGHIESPSLESDMEYIKQKIDAGADFAVTQMFFDNKYFYSMMERMKKKGVTVPVFPGMMPLADIDKIRKFAEVNGTTLPGNIEETMERFRGKPEDMEKAGLDFTIKQCRDLKANGFKRLHLFTLNKLSITRKVLDAI